MFSFLKTLSITVLAAATAVQAYSNPGACSGACWAHDPAIIQRSSDGKYYKFNTGGNIEIATATSLSGPWTLQGYVLTSGSSISNDGSADCWVRRILFFIW
jgi:arabinan endo-1,5-alpha-L-arabinosidase